MNDYVPIPDDPLRIPTDIDMEFDFVIHDIRTVVRVVNVAAEERLTVYIDGDQLFTRYGVILSDTHVCQPKKRWWRR